MKVPDSDVFPFSLGARKTPKFINSLLLRNITACKTAQKLDLVYVMIKPLRSDERVIPGWTGFNTTIRDVIPFFRIGYLPVFDASPTEFAAIHTILKRWTEIADRLQLQYAALVFNEAIYSTGTTGQMEK